MHDGGQPNYALLLSAAEPSANGQIFNLGSDETINLRDLAALKNAAFRQSMLGREVTAVTMEPLGLALTDNYIKAQMNLPYTSNRLVRLRPRALTEQGVTADVLSEL